MREHLRELVESARRATRTEPADQRFDLSWNCRQHPVDAGSYLAAHAVRMAQIAVAVHMAEAARLTSEMERARPQVADVAEIAP